MRGLTQVERRALIIDPGADGECISDAVFAQLARDKRGRWVRERWWHWSKVWIATPAGELALRVCP
jgi:hypothetical protein